MSRNSRPHVTVAALQWLELRKAAWSPKMYVIERTNIAHLARRVHELYFNPQHVEVEPRTLWSLSNAFTSAFKKLDSIPRFKATAKLGEFLESRSPLSC
jgi:hypothetical protein